MRPILTARILTAPILAATLLGAAGCTAGASYSAGGGDASGYAANADGPELTRLLEGRVAGTPKSCLSAFERRDSRTFNGTMVFRTRGKTIYRNDFGGCPQLNDNAIAVFRTPTGTLCSGEIVQLLDRASRFPVGACSVGPFVPYTRVAGR